MKLLSSYRNVNTFILSLLCFIIISITPILYGRIGKLGYVLLFPLIVVSSYNYFKRINISIRTDVSCYCFLILYIAFYKAIGISSCTWNKVMMYVLTFYFFLIPPLLLYEKAYKSIKFFILLSLIASSINVCDNIRLLIMYPGASEALNFEWGEEFKGMNIGGSTFVSFVTFLGLFYSLILTTQTKCRFLLWVLILLSFVYILLSGRAISVITFFVCFILIMSLGHNHQSGNRWVPFAILGAVVAIVVYNIDTISQLLTLYLESDRLSDRLLEATSMGSSDRSSGSGGGRLQLYWMSISTFLHSPINFLFGIGETISERYVMNKNGIGAHSAFFDFAAEYGLIGIILYIRLIVGVYKHTYRKIKKNNPASMVILYAFLISACINNVVTIPCLVVVFMLVPSYLYFLHRDIVKIR